MGHNNGIITTPVSVNDVRTVLGAASTDVGTLCTHRNVNMWSKCKPVRFPDLKNNNEWKGDTVDVGNGHIYGLYRPWSGGSPIEEIAELPIEYLRPTGGMESPYRLTDFDGYNHRCKCPWEIELPEGSFFANTAGVLVTFRKFTENELPTGNITVADLLCNKSPYVCVAVKNETGETMYKTFPSDSPTLNIANCPLFVQGATLTLYIAFCSKATTNWSDGADNFTTAGFYSMATRDYPTVSTIRVVEKYENHFYVRTRFPGEPPLNVVLNSVVFSNGYVRANTTWDHKPDRDYTLSSITLSKTELLADGNRGETITSSYPLDGVKPEEVSRWDYSEMGGLSGLPIEIPLIPTSGKIYSYTFTLNYT